MSKITLTIDNGPHAEETPKVLSVLAQRDIKAHFFVVGAQADKPGSLGILEQIICQGHVVGNHTWSHRIPFGDNRDPNAVADEVIRAEQLLAPYMGDTKLFRPFGGGGRLDACLFSPSLITYLCEQKYTCALWDNVPRDWEDLDGWVETALANITPDSWSVVVVHDYLVGNGLRIGNFIDAARQAGHEFVSEISPQCLPIVDGVVMQDLSAWTTVS